MSIIGLGRIAQGFDVPEGPGVSTHLKACLADRRWRIERIGDADTALAADVRARWNLDAEILPPEAIAGAAGDALCIASPDATHADYLDRALAGRWRTVVCEKPAGLDAGRRTATVDAFAVRGTTLAINHLRRQIPPLAGIAARAAAGAFGAPVSCAVHCSGGFLHNGIHALDLVTLVLGPVQPGPARLVHPAAFALPVDPTSGFALDLGTKGGMVPFLYVAVDPSVQTAFDVDIRFEKARVLITDCGGVRLHLAEAGSAPAPGYSPELRETFHWHDDPPGLMGRLWSNVADHLLDGSSLRSAARDMLAAYALHAAIGTRLAGAGDR